MGAFFAHSMTRRKDVCMAVAQNLCPNCHQTVPSGVHACPHCGVYLQLPIHVLSGEQSPVRHEQAGEVTLGVHSPRQAPVSSPLSTGTLTPSLPDALKQLDTTAGNNITISGVLIAFYSGAIFAGKVVASEVFYAIVYALPIALLLLTIILSVQVFYPRGYLTTDYPTLLKIKGSRLNYSSLLLEISVAAMALSVFVYLLR
jgi:hypothetical protein